MKKSKTARKYNSSIISELLADVSREEKLQTNNKMLLASRLDDLRNSRGWGRNEFAKKANKNASEITKWLSGTHNFTIDTLSEIALAFNMQIGELFEPKQIQELNKFHIVIKVKQEKQSIQYVTPYDDSDTPYAHSYPYSEIIKTAKISSHSLSNQ